MRNRRKEKDGNKPVLLIVFTAVLVSFLLSFFAGQSGILRLKQLRREYEALEMQNYRLAFENKKTREEIRRLKSDPAAIEKIAREELHYASPHDVILIVPSNRE